MENDIYRNLSPDDRVLAYEEFILIAVSKLLNKKSQNKEFLASVEVDCTMLSGILESIELGQQKNNFMLRRIRKYELL